MPDTAKKLRDKMVDVPMMMGGCVNISEKDATDLYRILYKILGNLDDIDSKQ